MDRSETIHRGNPPCICSITHIPEWGSLIGGESDCPVHGAGKPLASCGDAFANLIQPDEVIITGGKLTRAEARDFARQILDSLDREA